MHTTAQIVVYNCTAGIKADHTGYRDPLTNPNEAYGMHLVPIEQNTCSSAMSGRGIEESQMYEPIDKID